MAAVTYREIDCYIVDKTASFVARNGPEFESRIRQNEINNPKFNFLNNGDPYNAYFQHKVKEFKESLGKGAELAITPFPSAITPAPQKPKPLMQQQVTIPESIIPKEPPPEFEFMAEPPSISALDL
ncbi:splicing factor 3A subunit 1-like [Exaiptasia diaphana]|uniref:SURP motif domain-containing protein n=1 Tax=Exaiptasia diaphana TaxID=2652724 RepID=A0A913YJW2_EXADI|nr:splicing factor 3A subunit 1-like [Exaiptasia diaphana]